MTGIVAFIERRRVALSIAATLAVLALAFVALHHLLAEVKYHDIRQAVRVLGGAQFVPAILLTALSYTALTGYDYLALRSIGRRLPYRTVALASFTSYTLSHNLGLALLTKVAPQLNAINVMFPAKIGMTLLLVGLSFPVLPEAVERLADLANQAMSAISGAG